MKALGQVALSALAILLVAAANLQDASFERLGGMPPRERARLLENLRRYDLTLSPDQQSAVRELDRQLAGLSADQRAVYLTVLRRYHTWLNGLPEPRQDELAAKPSGERMVLVRKLIADRPVPAADTPPALRVIETGEYNPFEVASAFRIWQVLNEKERTDLERMSTEHARREALFRFGARPKHAIPRETGRADFDEEKWIGLLKSQAGELRVMTPPEERPKTKLAEAVRKRVEGLLPEIARRQAINLYVARAEVRGVDPERLARFMVALPRWVLESFDPLPPDEARRRMTFAYRLVFPYPEEIGVDRKSNDAHVKGRAQATPKPGTATVPKRKSPEIGGNASPF